MKKAFYIKDFLVRGVGYNALNKSRLDLCRIYESLGFERLDLEDRTLSDEKFKNVRKNSKALAGYVEEVLSLIDAKIHGGEFLFMDFPFAVKFLGFSKIVTYARSKGIKVVFFIHDLDGIRFQNPLLNILDSSCLDDAYALISASPAMDRALRENLKISRKLKIVDYDYWDYLLEKDVLNDRRMHLLCFGGNLAKSSFLSALPPALVQRGVALYGKGMQKDYRGDFLGEFDPETLVEKIDGYFGLVWDGKSAKTCSGNFGKYLRINTSHKFALYMAARKPVVVWKESPLADIVRQKKIGVAVSSLYEIPYRLSEIPYGQYREMVRAVDRMRKDIVTGEHLQEVIRLAMH